ncbi:beta-ketoacyl-ACP synthase III [Streptomyces netropsis]|uniref:beta-ketoacyl-ACP synthase III n=1 Tax=Streptomyces netropsis TaxID=55404 RepID=UPI00161E6B2D|nr:beta-ketoacyl-ACP synthase III [Streptomyces netropsis]GGR31877.1 3-oxoacyl-[acyl-carrier-protein] synthase 3 protein 5 [Streptomyces netropsis]
MASSASVVAGVGSHLPPRVIRNDDPALANLGSSDEWIRSRTGIECRRWVEPGISTGDLAVEAGRAALQSAGDPVVDLVVLATTTPDHHSPATAPWVAAQLGLGTLPAFDVAAACSGFTYGLAVGDAWIRSGMAEGVLVLAAETLSTITDPSDRGTAVVFADGAGAVVLRSGEQGEPGAVQATCLGSDGTQKDLAVVEAGGSRRPDHGGVASEAERCLRMQGPHMFAHAVRRMTEVSRELLERAGWPVDSIGAFIGHQANQRILDKVADLVGVPDASRFGNIHRVGNTSSASIPLVMDDLVKAQAVAPGTRTLLTAFGGGAVWGAVALSWPDLKPARR